jgi:hypothetical protein
VRNCQETTSLEEGREKLSKGMQVLIREGTVSQDLAALVPLIDEFTSPFLGFCTDDRNPLDIDEEGHIDHLVRRAIALGARRLRSIALRAGRRRAALDCGIAASWRPVISPTFCCSTIWHPARCIWCCDAADLLPSRRSTIVSCQHRLSATR